MRIVLGIDQSLDFGWCIGEPSSSRPEWGLLKLPRGSDDDRPVFRKVREFIRWAIVERGVTDVFFEQTFLADHQNMRAEFGKIGLASIIIDRADEFGDIEALQVPISAWRSRFTGHTRVPVGITIQSKRREWWKDQAKIACADRGWLIADHNIAEAVGIWDYGCCCVSTEYEAKSAPLFRRRQFEVDRRGNAA